MATGLASSGGGLGTRTLFLAVGSHGSKFGRATWQELWWELLFPLVRHGLRMCMTSSADEAPRDSGGKLRKSRSQVLAESGLEYLRQGDHEKAQQVFNTALKFDIKSVPLHFFNALNYHLKHEKGDPESFKLAEAGYRTAVLLDPTMEIAHMQLGRLYLSVGRYADAQKSFALAVDANPTKPEEALFGLARAALLNGDSATSAWAVKKLEDARWTDARLYRLKAFQAAVAAKPAQAREMLARYIEQETSAPQRRYVDTRIGQLLAVKTSAGMQLVADQAPAAEKADEAKAEEAPKEGEKAAEAAPKKNWFSCDTRPAPVLEKDITPMATPTPSVGGDEGWVTYALPMPCDGKNPPMAMIEVTMVRTEEKDTQTYGVNLLEGLKVATAWRFSSGAATTNFRTRSFFNEPGTDALTTGILSYSLNIANSLYEKNEVVARPTLAAIDRLPSVFFSGSTYSVQVGSANTGYTLADKQVGISLSVTPTFVNDDEILLSIRASRSFLEAGESTTIKLTQTRNTVNANAMVNYGETFVLNGLVEREKDKIQTGTPLFQEIPILQYFFKKSITVDYNRQILTLVTVRRLVDSDEEIAKAKNKRGLISKHKLSNQVDAFVDLQQSQPVLDEVLESLLKDNGLYKRLKARDLIQESMSHHNFIERIIQDVKDMLYF
mgnify:CR=1 FL=1